MDRLESYRHTVTQILGDYAKIPYAHPDITSETVFDREADRYLLMVLGREQGRHVHSCIVHIDIIGDKIWIQRDGTEYGIAQQLVDSGVPKQNIVLGFKSPAIRQHTEFAVA